MSSIELSRGFPERLDASDLAEQAITAVGINNPVNVVEGIVGDEYATFGEKLDALTIAGKEVPFLDDRAIKRELVIRTIHRHFRRRRPISRWE